MTNDIPCTLIDRRWMRAARSWRCFLLLPNDSILAGAITAMIDSRVTVTIQGVEAHTVTIEPAYVVDVPTAAKKRFHLVIETDNESQKDIGPRLTAMTGKDVLVTIVAYSEHAPAKVVSDRQNIGPNELRGLHTGFFKNPQFCQYIGLKMNVTVEGEEHCKAVFKEYLNVESCRDIAMNDFKGLLKTFNLWLGA